MPAQEAIKDQIAAREGTLQPVYLQVAATKFADTQWCLSIVCHLSHTHSCNNGDSGSSGVDNGALALSAVPCLLMQQRWWQQRHGQWHLGIFSRPSLAHTTMVTAAAAQTMAPWHHWPSLAPLGNGSNGGITSTMTTAVSYLSSRKCQHQNI
jgi:hypothetical protein